MLLQKLVEFADRLEEEDALAPPLYREKPIRYLISLNQAGQLLGMSDLGDKENKFRGRAYRVPHIGRSSGVKPILLADHAEYTLGLAREGAKPERVEQSHAAYLDVLTTCVSQSEDAAVNTVLIFLQNEPLSQLQLSDEFDAGGMIMFEVAGQLVHRRAAVRNFWVTHHSPQKKKDVMQCIVCGETKPVVERLPGKIKRVPGGQTSGTALISANSNAFESYGLKASQVAPICLECADRFTKALNYLLQNDDHYVRFSSLVFAFWLAEDVGFDINASLKTPTTEQAKTLINGVRTGATEPAIDETAFYAVSLSGSGGRTVVRDWIDSTVGEVKQSLARWFLAQEIVTVKGEAPRPLGIYALAAATVRDLRDVKTPTYRALLRVALNGGRLPMSLLQLAINRNHAERDVTFPRAALIKLVLATHNDIKENTMIELKTDRSQDPAYHCGRLLAVLESVQRTALGKGINATIVDRYYGSASTAPASIFGRLLRGAQPHLAKLRKENKGAEYRLQQELEEVLSALPKTFPSTLTLKQQGHFALGYYHQRADNRAAAQAKSAEKQRAKLEEK